MMNLTSFIHDTTREAAARQLETLCKMDLAGRAKMTFQLSDNLRSIVQSDIRQRHPEYTADEVNQAWLSLILDKSLVEQAYGGRKVSP